jgi:hypothetical protein
MLAAPGAHAPPCMLHPARQHAPRRTKAARGTPPALLRFAPQARNRATAETVAVKSISKAKLVCKEDVKDVQAEVAIMNLVGGHPHIVTLLVRGRARPAAGAGARGWGVSAGASAVPPTCSCALARVTPRASHPAPAVHPRGQGLR